MNKPRYARWLNWWPMAFRSKRLLRRGRDRGVNAPGKPRGHVDLLRRPADQCRRGGVRQSGPGSTENCRARWSLAIGQILRTGLPVRLLTYEGTDMAEIAAHLDISSTVTVPVVAEGRIWGTLSTASNGAPPPPETEYRLTQFAHLAAAAIANAETGENLRASRARVVAAADETRRRLQRDVHDSAQQRLVHTIIALQLAEGALNEGGEVRALIEEALRNARRANHDIRNIIRGILPDALTHGGLTAELKNILDGMPMPVKMRVRVPRLTAALESTAYFVVAETLTNVAKHAQADKATVDAQVTDEGILVLEVRDNGRGGADATPRKRTHRPDRPSRGEQRNIGLVQPGRAGNNGAELTTNSTEQTRHCSPDQNSPPWPFPPRMANQPSPPGFDEGDKPSTSTDPSD